MLFGDSRVGSTADDPRTSITLDEGLQVEGSRRVAASKEVAIIHPAQSWHVGSESRFLFVRALGFTRHLEVVINEGSLDF